ncbi:hypothetical protein [Deinococcus altitudinis]|uniref:hypothetical protein n=1 Tax=Deinococcus altitudinis TaxID=468914 RepID=UPI0038915C06
MIRFVPPLALLLTATALACPVRTGYFANGQFKDTTGLVPQCSAGFRKLAADVKAGEYGEIYKTTLNAVGGFRVAKAFNLFRANGWTSSGVARKGNDKTYVFTKGKKQTVMLVREDDRSVLIVLIGDK